MGDVPQHHIIYGTCEDYVTGETIVDTDDERYRQKLARLLVEERGYCRSDLEVCRTIETLFNRQFVVSKIAIVVKLDGRPLMLIRYAPGSLVTRERAAIAAARVLEEDLQIPLAVVTNGEDAELLDTYTGKVLDSGLSAILEISQLRGMARDLRLEPFAQGKKRERELRILNAFDVEVCCAGAPCALPGAVEGADGTGVKK